MKWEWENVLGSRGAIVAPDHVGKDVARIK
jgi:hypothetical protein